MTRYIAISRLNQDQKIPRPFNRASSVEEMQEMLRSILHYHAQDGFEHLTPQAVGTEHPVLTCLIEGKPVKFYAFFEEE